MNPANIQESIDQFGRVLSKLEEVLERSAESDDIVLDATIQRAEIIPIFFKGITSLNMSSVNLEVS